MVTSELMDLMMGIGTVVLVWIMLIIVLVFIKIYASDAPSYSFPSKKEKKPATPPPTIAPDLVEIEKILSSEENYRVNKVELALLFIQKKKTVGNNN